MQNTTITTGNNFPPISFWAFDTKDRKPKKPAPKVYDSDNDGVPDSLDLCPDIPGSIHAKGCPDSDGDGVPDFIDECPDVRGLPQLKGCPDVTVSSQNTTIPPKNDERPAYAQNTSANIMGHKDSDGDGVPDVEDLCPDIFGSAKTLGCPDSDDDGVADYEDDCPYTPGLAIHKGCPDSDNDGIPDNLDVCPYEKGVASNNGCPESKIITSDNQPIAEVRTIEVPRSQQEEFIPYEQPQNYQPQYYNYYNTTTPQTSEPVHDTAETVEKVDKHQDTDGDGVPDPEDKCPTVPGLKSNNGCPLNSNKLIKIAKRDIILLTEDRTLLENILTNVAFEKGRMLLTSNSYAHLDKLCQILSKHNSWKITISCYTDEADNTYRNQQLSSNRGQQIQNYLILKGVDSARLTIKGNGYAPVADLPSNRIELMINRD